MQSVKWQVLTIVSLDRKDYLNQFGNCILREMDNNDDFTFCQASVVLSFHVMKL